MHVCGQSPRKYGECLPFRGFPQSAMLSTLATEMAFHASTTNYNYKIWIVTRQKSQILTARVNLPVSSSPSKYLLSGSIRAFPWHVWAPPPHLACATGPNQTVSAGILSPEHSAFFREQPEWTEGYHATAHSRNTLLTHWRSTVVVNKHRQTRRPQQQRGRRQTDYRTGETDLRWQNCGITRI